MNIQAIASPLTQGEKIALAERLLPHAGTDNELHADVVRVLRSALIGVGSWIADASGQGVVEGRGDRGRDIGSVRNHGDVSQNGGSGSSDRLSEFDAVGVSNNTHGSIPGKTGVDQVSLGSKSPREATSSKARNGVRK